MQSPRRNGAETAVCSKAAWGFPTLAASAASKEAPVDFILHVGDYHYREYTGADQTTCHGYSQDPQTYQDHGWVHCGKNWASWQDDFFDPVRSGGLLGLAPWIFVRGNHEDCQRAWQGWFLFFYPGAAPDDCAQDDLARTHVLPPYTINLDRLDLYVVDSSDERGESAMQSFQHVAQDLNASKRTAWLVTHVPEGSYSHGHDPFAESCLGQNPLLAWVLAGHVHNFQHHPAGASMRLETVVGGSGTKLDGCGVASCSTDGPADCCYTQGGGGAPVGYSYLRVDASQSGATATLKDVQGQTVYSFDIP